MGSLWGWGDPARGGSLLRSLTYHTAFTASELRTGSLTSQEESYIIYIAEYAPYITGSSPRPVSGMRKRQHGSQKGNKQRIEKIFLLRRFRGKLPGHSRYITNWRRGTALVVKLKMLGETVWRGVSHQAALAKSCRPRKFREQSLEAHAITRKSV
jgi:hypothetical protein